MYRKPVNIGVETSKGLGPPCPECGYTSPRYQVMWAHTPYSSKWDTGCPCPECGVTLYRQYAKDGMTLRTRFSVVAWPVFFGSTIILFLAAIVESNLWRPSSPFLSFAWLLLYLPMFSIAWYSYASEKRLNQTSLTKDVGEWSLAKRRLTRYSPHAMIIAFVLYTVAEFNFPSVVLGLTGYLALYLLAPGVVMAILGYPYAYARTPNADDGGTMGHASLGDEG